MAPRPASLSAVILILFALPLPLYAQQLAPGLFHLQTALQIAENKCLNGNSAIPETIANGAAFLDDCANVDLEEGWDGTIAPAMEWRAVPLPDGWFQLQIRALGDAMCLEGNNIHPAAFLDGASYMMNCFDIPGQKWQAVDAGSGWLHLKTELGGDTKCLEGNRIAADSVLRGGAYLGICYGSPGQMWKATDLAAPPAPSAAPIPAPVAIAPSQTMPEPVGISGKDLKSLLPRLEGPFPPSTPAAMVRAKDYEVPFFMINDPKYNQLEQWLITPTYVVTRSVSYKFYREYDNTDCAVPSANDGTFTYVTGTEKGRENSRGSDTASEFSQTMGISLTSSVEVGGEATGGKVSESIELSSSWASSFSMSYSMSESTSDSATEETTWEQTVPRGTYAALYLKTSTYEVRRNGAEDDGQIDSSKMSFDHDQPIFLTWAPEGWSARNPCGAQLGEEATAAALRGDDVVVKAESQAPANVGNADAPVPVVLPQKSGLLSCSINGMHCTDTTSSGYYMTQDQDRGQARIVEFADGDVKPVVTVETVVLADGRKAVQFLDTRGRYLRVDASKEFHASFDGEKADHATYFVTTLPLEGSALDHASCESALYPARYLRHRGMMLFADPEERGSELFRRDGTWRVVNLGH